MERAKALPLVDLVDRFTVPLPFERCGAPADVTPIGFDDLPLHAEVSDQYAEQGVTFSGSPNLSVELVDDDVGTSSPPAALTNLSGATPVFPDRFGREAPTAWSPVDGDVVMRFTEPVTRVSALVGLPTGAADLLAVAPTETRRETPEVTATLELVSGTGAVLATDTARLGPDPTAVGSCLAVRQPSGDTAQGVVARISYDPPVNETVDDVWFQRDLPVPAEPPSGRIEIDTPVRDDRITVDDPVTVSGSVVASVPVRNVRVSWSCRKRPPPEYGSFTVWRRHDARLYPDPGDPLRTRFVTDFGRFGDAACGAEHEVDVRASAELRHPSDPWVSDTRTVTAIMPEAIEDAPAVGVRAVELTQGVRTDLLTGFDGSTVTDPMTHVADRATVLRVYPELLEELGEGETETAWAQLYGYRGSIITPLAGTPVSPDDQVTVSDDPPSLDEQRRDPSLTWDFRLPANWTADGLTRLQLRLYPAGITPSTFYACRGCARSTIENIDATFSHGGQIDLYFHRVELTKDEDGNGVNIRAPNLAEIGGVIRQLYQYLPLGDGDVDLRTVRGLTWAGPIEEDDGDGGTNHLLHDAMRDRYLVPAGITEPDPVWRGTMFGFYFGDAPDDTGRRGCGGRGWLDMAYFHSGACASWSTVPTHESLHTLGLEHASNRHGEAGGGGFDASYPGTCGQVSYGPGGGLTADTFGVDVLANPIEVLPPDVNPTPTDGETGACDDVHLHDLLSYGWGADWISPYTWSNALSRSGGPDVTVAATSTSATQDREPRTLLAVTLGLNGGVEVRSTRRVELPDPGQGDGEVEVEAVSATGDTVVTRRVDVPRVESDDTESGSIVVLLPESGWDELVVRRDGEEIGRVTTSGSAPEVAVEPPSGPWGPDTPLTVAADLDDADGGPLSVLVEVAGEDGAWEGVASTTTDPGRVELQIPRGASSVTSGEVRVRVQASDGLRATVSDAVTVDAAPRAPTPAIIEPTGLDPIPPGSVFEIVGDGWTNAGEPVPEARLQWLIDGEIIGHGRRFVAGPLEAGEHTLELRAADGDGAGTSTSIRLLVADDEDGDGLADDWESANGLDPNDGSDASSDGDGDGLDARGEQRWGTDPSVADDDGDGMVDGVEVRTGGVPDDPAISSGGGHGLDAFVAAHTSEGGGASRLLWFVGALVVAALVAILARRRFASR